MGSARSGDTSIDGPRRAVGTDEIPRTARTRAHGDLESDRCSRRHVPFPCDRVQLRAARVAGVERLRIERSRRGLRDPCRRHGKIRRETRRVIAAVEIDPADRRRSMPNPGTRRRLWKRRNSRCSSGTASWSAPPDWRKRSPNRTISSRPRHSMPNPKACHFRHC